MEGEFEDNQKCPKCDGLCEDTMWYHTGSIDYKCEKCGYEFNKYVLGHLDKDEEE